ncbi:MAG: hypothetical protein ACHQ2Z_06740 [Elusimicrobiota bacterium]
MNRRAPGFALIFALVSMGARAQEAWPPSLDSLPRLSVAAPAGAEPLQPGLLESILPKIAEYNSAGCGDEAARVLLWGKGRKGIGLSDARLSDETGAAFAVSPALVEALRNANSYFGMTPATQAALPTHAEISAAALSPAGVEAIARIFERTIADRLSLATGVIVPEAGGEASLDSQMRMHEIPEMTRAVLPRIVRNSQDPEALSALYARYPEEMKVIDPDGQLMKFLRNRPQWIERGMPQENIDKVLRVTLDGLLRNATDSYVFDPKSQLDAIVSQSWSGRYIGRWHTHPPRARAHGWGGADGPSPPDMDIAVQEGQNMVIVFDPDGFDLYDLAPLEGKAPDLNKILKDSYRSAAWRDRFQALFEQAFPDRR